MSFSAFNVGRQAIISTGNINPRSNFGSKPIAGGSFTPSTLEAAFVLRSSLDYQYETAFVDQHRAKMQNRLNDLSKTLNEAYTDLLNVSMSQQIGEKADVNLRSDVKLDGRDGSNMATLIQGILGENGFEDLGLAQDILSQLPIDYINLGNNTTNILNLWRSPSITRDRLNGSDLADDGHYGYGRVLGAGAAAAQVQFKTLMERITAAGNVAGNIDLTVRIEDDPPEPAELNQSLELLNSITSAVLGGPGDPTYFNQKVEQTSTTFKTGGFWSTVNYLYNFAPREFKYSYAVGHTINSDEAGDTEYLIDGKLVDFRDNPNVYPTANPQGYTETDNRLKWASFNPTEGYQHERSGTTATYPTVINRQKAWIDATADANSALRWYADGAAQTDAGRVHIVENLIFQSGTYTFKAVKDVYDVNGDGNRDDLVAYFISNGTAGSTLTGVSTLNGKTVQFAGKSTDTGGITQLLNSNIQEGTTFRHKVDMGQTLGLDETEDRTTPPTSTTDQEIHERGAIRSSLFFNHYEVETRTVEFNNKTRTDIPELTAGATPGNVRDDAAGSLYVYGDIKRSTSIDATKNYDLVTADHDNNPATPDTSEINRTTGNVNNSFNGEFIQSQHKILSVNGQNVVGNDSKQASPILGNFEIGKYEGVQRSLQMNRNIVQYTGPTEMEIDAANSVPTDWHQAELLVNPGAAAAAANPQDPANGFIWFPHVADTLYSRPDTDIAPSLGYGRENGFQQLLQARNTFDLGLDDFMQLQPAASWVTDPTGVRRPTYAVKPMTINLQLKGVHYNDLASPPQVPKIFINGQEVLAGTSFVSFVSNGGITQGTVNYQINLTDNGIPTFAGGTNGSYVRQGLNTITIQASDGTFQTALGNTNFDEGIRITAAPVSALGNSNEVNAVLNSRVITGYSDVLLNGNTIPPDVKYNSEMTRPNTVKAQSRWQTRLVPATVAGDTSNKLLKLSSDPSSTGTSYKTANSFIEMIIGMINQQKYRDIFKLGMLSNLDKLAISGQANLPSGSSMEGAITMYFDQNKQAIVLNQDKLIAKS